MRRILSIRRSDERLRGFSRSKLGDSSLRSEQAPVTKQMDFFSNLLDKEADMPDKVLIFGKDTCPYTTAAREDYSKRGYEVEYINVKDNPLAIKRMCMYSGETKVPVIVEGGDPAKVKVIIGFGGT